MTSAPPRARQILALLLFAALSFAAAGLGSLFTADALDSWYPGLDKPPWTPPDWVFGPVWTVLYALIAVAAWRVWLRDGSRASGVLALWGAQLVLNAGWSFVFFGLQEPGWATLEIALLWGAIAATAVAFWARDRAAGALLVPYLLWVSFAAALTFAIWRLNA